MDYNAPTINESFLRLWNALSLGTTPSLRLSAMMGQEREVQDTFIAALAACSPQEIVVPALAQMEAAAEKLAHASKERQGAV